MKKFKFNKREYNIPNSWDDINLRQYVELRRHQENFGTMPQEEFFCTYITILTDMPYDEVENLNIREFDMLAAELLKLTETRFELPKQPWVELDGRIFYLDKDLTKYTIGQLSDLDAFVKDTKGDIWEAMDKVSASLIREVESKSFKFKYKKMFGLLAEEHMNVKKYTYEDCMANAQLFLNRLPMTYIYLAADFFLHSRGQSPNSTQSSTQNGKQVLTEKNRKN